MISLDDVSKGWNGRVLFEHVSLRLSPRERIGIVGPNGAGKTTLLSLLAGREPPDAGSVSRIRDLTVGELPQELLATPDATVLETALRPSGRIAALEAELARLPGELERSADEAEQHRLAARLAEAHALYADLGGHDREARAKRILAGLGFAPGAETRKQKTFSGGYVMRAELARLLTDLPDVLLLDEPTNHLDLESVLWLQGFLSSCPATLVVISHDRAFLTATASSIVEVEGGRVTRYAGNYEDYLRERELRRAQLEARARDQERRIRETERFIERFRSKATKATQVQSRIKALAREERIVVAPAQRKVRFRFPQPERTAEIALELRAVAKAYGDHVVYRGLDFVLKRGEKTVLVGPNGAGKSTLLKLLAGAIPPDAGERRVGLRATVGYYTQHRHDMLALDRSVLENAMSKAGAQGETTVRTLLGAFLFHGDDVNKPAAVLSGGEKSRLALALILLDPPAVLLMDEPTIHLDIPSVDALIAALEDFEGSLCFVSHDVHFIRHVARRVVRVEGGALEDFAGDWEYYCWKRAQISAASAAPAEPRGAARPSAEADQRAEQIARSAQGLRLERRLAAEARAEIARRTKTLRLRVGELEARIDELEREKAGIEGDLGDPATYERGGQEIAALQRRHAEVEHELAARMDEWSDAQEALESALDD